MGAAGSQLGINIQLLLKAQVVLLQTGQALGPERTMNYSSQSMATPSCCSLLPTFCCQVRPCQCLRVNTPLCDSTLAPHFLSCVCCSTPSSSALICKVFLCSRDNQFLPCHPTALLSDSSLSLHLSSLISETFLGGASLSPTTPL